MRPAYIFCLVTGMLFILPDKLVAQAIDSVKSKTGGNSLVILSSDTAKPKSDNAKKENNVVIVIPLYCNTQLFCIVKKRNDIYEIDLFNKDQVPEPPSKEDSAILKQFYTGQTLDYVGFKNFMVKEYGKGKTQSTDSCDAKTDYLFSKIQDELNKYVNNKTTVAQNKVVDSLTQLLVDFDRVSGEIKLNKKVHIYKLKKPTPIHISNTQILIQDKLFKLDPGNIDYTTIIGDMDIIKATVQIDNNRIFDISFVADVYNTRGELIRRLNTISNNYYSLSFKGLNSREYTRTIETEEYPDAGLIDGFGFNYGDVINYQPRNGDFSPIVKNELYNLSTDSTVAIYRRRYSDYLSFRTFLDPLGFLGNNPNGFVELEGDGVIPLNNRSTRRHTWFPSLHANFSYIYNNTINSDPRQAPTIPLANDSFKIYNPTTQSYLTKTDTSNYINNLDIVRKAYYQLYFRASVYSREFKGQNSFLDAQIGFHVLGAKVASKSDTTTYHKFIPEFNLQWTFRPDNIFGGDLNLGVGYLGTTHKANNSPSNINNASFLWNNAWVLPHELNIYVLTGKESKGGLFMRYIGWLAFNTNLASSIDERLLPSTTEIRKTAYFPQILFGYSTNLSTLIKRSGTDR